ncbi:MAG TPA: VanZ family protein [Acidobacteriota bacterium]|nr:VanZ family protein [Acidobacteriota bacterium]
MLPLSKYAGPATIAITVGYFLVGLWPFNFAPRNTVVWPPGESALAFSPQSIVFSEYPIELSSGSITIELLLTSELDALHDIHCILSLYDGAIPSNLLIGQWKSSLLLRVPLWDSAGRRKYREVGVIDALRNGRLRFIALTSGPAGTAVYVDGILARAWPRIVPQSGTLRGRLILGSSAAGGRSWIGKLFGLAVYDAALGASDISRHNQLWSARRAADLSTEPALAALYAIDEKHGHTLPDLSANGRALLIPDSYHVIHKTVLAPPWTESLRNFSHIEDIVINILGFVPFGFCFFIHLTYSRPGRWFKNTLWTVLSAGVVSLAIELIQVYLPTRSSSLTDLMCNVAGAVLGVIFAGGFSLVFRRAGKRV